MDTFSLCTLFLWDTKHIISARWLANPKCAHSHFPHFRDMYKCPIYCESEYSTNYYMIICPSPQKKNYIKIKCLGSCIWNGWSILTMYSNLFLTVCVLCPLLTSHSTSYIWTKGTNSIAKTYDKRMEIWCAGA
jgi:hypothetical protein